MTKTLRTKARSARVVLAPAVMAASVATALVVTMSLLAACGSSEQVSVGTGGSSGAGAPAQEPATTVPGPTEVYLGDMVRLGNSSAWQHGSAKMNTAIYEHSVWATTPCHASLDGTGAEWTFDLNKAYSKVTGQVGVTDDSDSTDKFKVQLLAGDDQVIGTYDVSLGVTAPIDASVSGSLRLKVKISQTAGTGCRADRVSVSSKIAFGDVKITK